MRPGGVGFGQGLVAIAHGAPNQPADQGGNLGEGHRLWTGQLVGRTRVRAWVTQDRGCDVSHVVASHRGHGTIAGRPTNDVVWSDQGADGVGVEVVPQEREAEVELARVLLGVPMIPSQREDGVRGGSHEAGVHDGWAPGGGDGVEKGSMLSDPSGALMGRDHEDGLNPAQRGHQAVQVSEGRRVDLDRRVVRCSIRIANDEPLREPGFEEVAGDSTAEPAGGPSNSDHASTLPRHP